MLGSFLLYCTFFRYMHRYILFYSLPYCGFRLPTPVFLGFPGGSADKESACNGFDPRVGKIPWRRERLPTPVFWLGEFHGLYSPWGHKESDTTEWLHFLLWFITGYRIQLPVPYRQTLLFIHPIYNSVHLLSPNSQSLPCCLPAASSLFPCLFLFRWWGHLCHVFRLHIEVISHVSWFLIIQCPLGIFILEKSSYYRVSKAEEEFKMSFIGWGLTAYTDVLD